MACIQSPLQHMFPIHFFCAIGRTVACLQVCSEHAYQILLSYRTPSLNAIDARVRVPQLAKGVSQQHCAHYREGRMGYIQQDTQAEETLHTTYIVDGTVCTHNAQNYIGLKCRKR